MEVKNLTFGYVSGKPVLKDVSFRVSEGKITTLLGANGCGKSTLFYLMTKNLTPDSGEILLDGQNIRTMGLRDFARRVSIVHQHNTASNDITVEKLVSYGRTPHSRMLRGQTEEDEKQIEWAMEVTNVTKYRNRAVSRLSGGQRQRVWIAMALAQNTKLLFLDEPTTYLDIRYQLQVLNLVRRLNREFGITIVMVLHEMNQAFSYSDRIIGLKDGRICVDGTPEEAITSEAIEQLYGIRLPVTTLEGRKVVLTGWKEEEKEERRVDD